MSKEVSEKTEISEIIPTAGLVYNEKGKLTEILVKPKIMPIKSLTLQKIEALEKEAMDQSKNEEKS